MVRTTLKNARAVENYFQKESQWHTFMNVHGDFLHQLQAVFRAQLQDLLIWYCKSCKLRCSNEIAVFVTAGCTHVLRNFAQVLDFLPLANICRMVRAPYILVIGKFGICHGTTSLELVRVGSRAILHPVS